VSAIDITAWTAAAVALVAAVLIAAEVRVAGRALMIAAMVAVIAVISMSDVSPWWAIIPGLVTGHHAQCLGKDLRKKAAK
jgi:hypothetical protein